MSTTPLVKITIDGQELEVPQGSMIIEAADQAHITIPRFCYHKKLSVAANCRMCLVDVANSRKPLPACATPVADGMVVLTKSEKAITYQKSVMEFLLINHPLDCPICDQGGECELQDQAMGYGKDVSRYHQGKRSVQDHDMGPLVETDLTRCIQCTRCVRFGTEIAGMRELGMTHRGEHSEISTFLNRSMDCELSGNVIDLCPVGALTNKPFRYQARAWELKQVPGVSPHDCLGSNLFVHVRRGEALRVVPRENQALNEVWLADRDRYSVHALNTERRATQPLLKKATGWEEVSWEVALTHVFKSIETLREAAGPECLAALASPSSTVEEMYLLQKLMRGLGSHHVDFRYHQADFSDQQDEPTAPISALKLDALPEHDLIVVIGADTRYEVPLFHQRLRQASLAGARIVYLNSWRVELNIPDAQTYLVNDTALTQVMAYLAKAVTQRRPLTPPYHDELQALTPQGVDEACWQVFVEALVTAQKPLFVTGQALMAHPHASEVMGLLTALKEALAAEYIALTPGANSAGGALAGCLPHRGAAAKNLGEAGLHAKAILDPASGLKAYVLLNVEPGVESLYMQKADQALKAADLVVALTPFVTEYLCDVADVILPIAAFTETSGTYVNCLGDWQSFEGAARPKGEARPAWKVFRVLANLLALPGFDYVSSEEVLTELRAHLVHMKPQGRVMRIPKTLSRVAGLQRIGILPLYYSDLLVRESVPLQKTALATDLHYIGVNAEHGQAMGLKEGDPVTVVQGEQTLTLPVRWMPLAQDHVFLPRGLSSTRGFGDAFSSLTLAPLQ